MTPAPEERMREEVAQLKEQIKLHKLDLGAIWWTLVAVGFCIGWLFGNL